MNLQDLDTSFDNYINQRVTWLKKAYESRAKLQSHLAGIAALCHATKGSISFDYDDTFSLYYTFTSLKEEAMPILEAIEMLTGDSFDKSADNASEWGASREFRLSKLPVKVCISLPTTGTSGCRRVQVGVKEVPVYELQCDE